MIDSTSNHNTSDQSSIKLFDPISPEETVHSPIEIASLLSAPSPSSSGGNQLEQTDHGKIAEHFLHVAELIEEHLTANFSSIGLNAVRFQVIKFVAAAAPEGCSQAELATEIGQSESSVSTLIVRMRQDGLLYRLKSNTDRRKCVLMLTEEGQQLLLLAQLSYAEQMEGLLSRLSIEQQTSLLEVLTFMETEISQSTKQNEATTPLKSAA